MQLSCAWIARLAATAMIGFFVLIIWPGGPRRAWSALSLCALSLSLFAWCTAIDCQDKLAPVEWIAIPLIGGIAIASCYVWLHGQKHKDRDKIQPVDSGNARPNSRR